MGADDELSPLLCGFCRGDFPVGDVGRDEAEQAILEDLRAVIHKVLLRGQLRQIFLLKQTKFMSRQIYLTSLSIQESNKIK